MSFHPSYLKLIDLLICARTRLCHQFAERIMEHSQTVMIGYMQTAILI